MQNRLAHSSSIFAVSLSAARDHRDPSALLLENQEANTLMIQWMLSHVLITVILEFIVMVACVELQIDQGLSG